MLAIAVAICVSLTSGCGSDKKPASGTGTDKKFTAAQQNLTIDKKDTPVETTFTNGDPKEVSPKEDNGVKAEVKDKKVVFTWTGDLPAEDKTANFTVKGGSTGNDTTTVKVTVKKKA